MLKIVPNPYADKIVETMDLGQRLLKEFGLDDWRFDLSSRKTSIGTCFYRRKLIVFSLNFLHISMEEIEDTIRHEIAHALLGEDHGHDETWKEMALKVGARPERLADESIESAAAYNYRLECPSCNREWHRYRLRFRAPRCPDCLEDLEIIKLR